LVYSKASSQNVLAVRHREIFRHNVKITACDGAPAIYAWNATHRAFLTKLADAQLSVPSTNEGDAKALFTQCPLLSDNDAHARSTVQAFVSKSGDDLIKYAHIAQHSVPISGDSSEKKAVVNTNSDWLRARNAA